jgi:hypothetical protein
METGPADGEGVRHLDEFFPGIRLLKVTGK